MAPERSEAEQARVEAASPAASPDPLVFVVGCPRSGTTLLQRILDHHPHLAVANDTHFVPRCIEKFAPGAMADALEGRTVALTGDLVRGVRDYHRVHRLGLADRDFEHAEAAATDYRGYVNALYSSFARARGKRLAGEKTPDYVRRIPLLAGLFPRTRFVHIFRDGRDVALSVLEWASESKGPGKLQLWSREPVATCALWWRWQVESGRESGPSLGSSRYLELQYESLVADPAGEARRVTEFLGLCYEERMIEYHKGKVRTDPLLSAKSRWLPPTRGLRDWRSEMAERDVTLFEVLAGDLLERLGYELSGRPPSAEIQRVAAGCRQWWEAFVAKRAAKERRRMENQR